MRVMPADDPLLIEVPERLETARLLLLAPRAGLGPTLNRAVLDAQEHLKPWMPWAHETPTVEQSEAVARRMQAQFLQRQHLAYYLHEREPDGRPGRLIGGAGLHTLEWTVRRYELGYWIVPTHVGRGLVAEAVVALARMAFGPLRARRLEIRTDSRNAASRAVAERCGFSLEGLLRDDALNVDGQLSDTCIYGMITINELIDPSL
ncbi:GNAT family N-acetyltransferase [Roseateles chitinivorans]|uniref:GNAT family N-acetyltransferase n=1 Tax=Roseateles chitinivorans TaxID=2917965 RepID=UPI003D67C8AE